MTNVNPLYVLLAGLALLVVLLQEKVRFVAALVVFLIVALAAAQMLGLVQLIKN